MPTPSPIASLALDRAALRDQLERACRPLNLPAPQPSGFADLDKQLPGGGWPVGALTECLLDAHGIGELRIWLPALRSVAETGRHIALINPPFLPYAPALAQQGLPLPQLRLIVCPTAADVLWAAEQTLRCSSFGAVLAWPTTATDKQLRRLQLAAEAGRNLGVLYRPLLAAQEHSPAALRIKLQPVASELQIVIHKSRGAVSAAGVVCL
jgi:hypothetical protein